MTKTKQLYTILGSGFSGISIDALNRLISNELSKDEEVMDTDLIDLCAEIIRAKREGTLLSLAANNARNKHSLKKAITVIAAAAILVSGTLAVSAKVFHYNIIDEIVEYFDEFVRIKFGNRPEDADRYALTDNDLSKELKAHGISPVTLPEQLLHAPHTVSKILYQSDEFFQRASILIQTDEHMQRINIEQYNAQELVGNIDVMHPSSATRLDVNGLDVFVFEHETTSMIVYRDRLTIYSITLECPLEEALEIANTIK